MYFSIHHLLLIGFCWIFFMNKYLKQPFLFLLSFWNTLIILMMTNISWHFVQYDRSIKINSKHYNNLILNLYVEFLGKLSSILFLFNYNRRKKCYISFSQAIKLVKSLSLFSTKYQLTSKQVIKILLAIITCQSCNIISILHCCAW